MGGLRNFHIEPTLEGCVCKIDPRCGGIVEVVPRCPEHGTHAQPEDIIDTHFHPVQKAVRALARA